MKKIILLIIPLFLNLGYNAEVSTPYISAEAYVLMEINTNRVISSSNEDERMLTASIAKILTAITAIENGDLDEEITVDEEAVLRQGSKLYLKIGEKLTLEDLLYGLMLRSGNDAAFLIAKNVGTDYDDFIRMMNDTAKKIGMTNSTFENASGLDADLDSYNYSTAYDMALLTSYAYKNEIYKEISGTENYTTKSSEGNSYVWNHKHRYIGISEINGGKTGYTEMANRTLVSTASLDGLDLVMVTFNDGNDFENHSQMFTQTFDSYKMTTILDKQILYYMLEYTDKIPIIEEDIKYPLNKNEQTRIRGTVSKEDDKWLVKIYLDDELILTKEIKVAT